MDNDITVKDEKELQLSEKQKAIHDGLKQIGVELSSFYLDGLRLENNPNFLVSCNLLAHISREIDGGIRDIFSSKNQPLEKCVTCGNTLNKISHQESICIALGCGKEDDLAKKWFDVAGNFHKFAHRRGAWTQPRDIKEFEKYWKDYEEILFQVLGSYYKLLDKLDVLLTQENPSDPVISTLPSLLQVEAREQYFFSKLNKVGWLIKLHDAGFFSPDKNPKPRKVENGYTLPYWSALSYVERMSKIIDEAHPEINTILGIIKRIIDYKEDGRKIDNSRTDFMIFKILCNIPISKLSQDHMRYIEDCLASDFHNSLISAEIGKTLIPKLIENKKTELLGELIKTITKFRVNDKSFSKIEPLIEEYWFKEIITKNLDAVTNFAPQEVFSIVLSRIKEITEKDASAFSVSVIPTIEDHPQKGHIDEYEVYLIKLITASINKLPNKREVVEQLLNEELIILQRIAVYFIGVYFDELKEVFFQFKPNPFDIPFCKHELYEFLSNNSKRFNESEVKSLIDFIEKKEYYVPEEIKEDTDKISKLLAYRKKELYSALLSSENKIIKEKYEHYDAINSSPLDHPGFITWHETWTGHFSPTTKEDLSKLSSEEIVKLLSDFKEERGIKTPSEMGLAETFESLVFDDPEKFSKVVQTYVNVKSIYIYSLIKAFTDAWNKNKEFDWKAVLEYIERIVKSEDFIKDKEGEFYYPEWVIAQIARLIEEGTRNDDHAFNVSLLPIASEILISLNKLVHVQESDTDDAVTYTLNTTKGKILSALLNLSLRIARTSKSEPKWLPELKSIFDKELSENPSLELNTTLAEYLPNFLYLDKDWVLSNITKIFPQTKEPIWKAAMQGYLFGSKVYKDLFHVMKKTGDYEKGLSVSISKRDMSERLVSHICIAYLEGWEQLDEKSDLIFSLIYNHKEYASEVIRFFWLHRKLIKEEQIPLIKQLWKFVFENNPENQEVLSDALKWLEFFKTIDDDIYKWSLEGAKYLKHNDSFSIIESLAAHVENNSEKVGKIFLQMVENIDILPDYKQEHIVQIVEALYEQKQKEIADKICNKYGSENVHFLREIYCKNNK